MKTMLEKLRDMKVGEVLAVKSVGWQANRVINTIHNLQTYFSHGDYLVVGIKEIDDKIFIERTK